MKKTEIENELRNRFFNALVKMYEDSGEDVQIIGKSVFALPVLDCEGNEAWVRIKVDIPKGQRGGDVFDGYSEAHSYEIEEAQKTEKRAKAAEEKARKIERDKKRREQLKEQRVKAKAEKGE